MPIITRDACADAEAPRLVIRRFTPDDDPAQYRRFHHIRTAVFAGELGWRLSEAAGPWWDPFDRGGHFFLAETADGKAVGILRALAAEVGFPHRELFARDLAATGLIGRDTVVGTVNALAVLPEHRGRPYRTWTDPTEEGTAAHLLLRSALADLRASGIRAVFATVLGIKSARSFLRVGFRLLDPPQAMPGQGRFLVANVGAVLGSSDEDASELACVGHHFARRHREVVESGTVDELFQQAEAVVLASHAI